MSDQSKCQRKNPFHKLIWRENKQLQACIYPTIIPGIYLSKHIVMYQPVCTKTEYDKSWKKRLKLFSN